MSTLPSFLSAGIVNPLLSPSSFRSHRLQALKDSEGKAPLWEAMVGGHKFVVRLLIENGPDLASGDVGLFACIAAELKDIVQYGGNVTLPKRDGYTALHVAVSEGNTETVKFLLDHGAEIDRLSNDGLSPRALADQQAHEEIIALFEAKKEKQE